MLSQRTFRRIGFAMMLPGVLIYPWATSHEATNLWIGTPLAIICGIGLLLVLALAKWVAWCVFAGFIASLILGAPAPITVLFGVLLLPMIGLHYTPVRRFITSQFDRIFDRVRTAHTLHSLVKNPAMEIVHCHDLAQNVTVLVTRKIIFLVHMVSHRGHLFAVDGDAEWRIRDADRVYFVRNPAHELRLMMDEIRTHVPGDDWPVEGLVCCPYATFGADAPGYIVDLPLLVRELTFLAEDTAYRRHSMADAQDVFLAVQSCALREV